MCVVPIVTICPLILEIVDDELQVWRYPGRLDRAEVDAEDLSGGKLIGNLWFGYVKSAFSSLRREQAYSLLPMILYPCPGQ